MPSFTPLDILYIVLAFCALWLSVAVFWLIWQLGSILRSVNDTLEMAQEKIARIESAITAMKSRFESLTSMTTLLVEGLKGVIEYAHEKKDQIVQARRRLPARRRLQDVMEDEEDQA